MGDENPGLLATKLLTVRKILHFVVKITHSGKVKKPCRDSLPKFCDN
jgi:hypothetical protein